MMATTEIEGALYELIQIKDRDTALHSQNVAKYAVKIAGESGIYDCYTLAKIQRAGLLHDIGKIFVDRDVLNKKEKLDENEWIQIHNHTTHGRDILWNFKVPEYIIDAAWHHHERYDGCGYPDGLIRDEIEPMTRIISVADCIDAMSRRRSYSKRMPIQDIVEELKRVRGAQLDPKYTDAAISWLTRNTYLK